MAGHGGKRPNQTGRPKKAEQTKSVAKLVQEGIETTVAEVRRVGVTEALMREVAIHALATLLHATRHGNVKAAMYLLDRVMTMPDRNFAEAVQEMPPEQIAEHLIGMLEQAGFSRETSEQIVTVIANSNTPEPEPLMALPEIIPDYAEGGVTEEALDAVWEEDEDE